MIFDIIYIKWNIVIDDSHIRRGAVINYDIPFNVKNIEYQLFDVQGKLITIHASDIQSKSGKLNVPVDNLNAGIYTCKIIVDADVLVRKLVIAK